MVITDEESQRGVQKVGVLRACGCGSCKLQACMHRTHALSLLLEPPFDNPRVNGSRTFFDLRITRSEKLSSARSSGLCKRQTATVGNFEMKLGISSTRGGAEGVIPARRSRLSWQGNGRAITSRVVTRSRAFQNAYNTSVNTTWQP
jgi:hypothetical protein